MQADHRSTHLSTRPSEDDGAARAAAPPPRGCPGGFYRLRPRVGYVLGLDSGIGGGETGTAGKARQGDRMGLPHFLVHSPKDNVGVVVVEGLKAGTKMLGVVTETDETRELRAKHDIPIGHKVALEPL